MSLTEKVSFTAMLQMANTVQVPKLIQWRFKMESGELLKVSVKALDSERYGEEEFLAKMATTDA